jgi:hypothetical protein
VVLLLMALVACSSTPPDASTDASVDEQLVEVAAQLDREPGSREGAPSEVTLDDALSYAVNSLPTEAPSPIDWDLELDPGLGRYAGLGLVIQDEEGKAAQPAEKKEVNTGQDPTHPLWRIDNRFQYRKVTGEFDSAIWTLRMDAPTPLDGGKAGVFYFRIDVPLSGTDAIGPDNWSGDFTAGIGDVFTNFLYITPPSWAQALGADAMALGMGWVWPTAEPDILGGDSILVEPVLALKWNLKSISKGSFIAPILRYRWNVTTINNEDLRDNTGELAIQPLFNIATTPWGWPIDFITFYENERIQINLVNGSSKDKGDIWIPMDVSVGKMVSDNVVMSMKLAFPIYKSKGYDLYDWYMEFRVGVFF